MVTGPDWRQALRLVEEVTMLLQEAGQQGMLRVDSGGCQLRLRAHRVCAAHALPPDAATQALEDHRQGVEVPEDGTQGPEKVDAQDEVEAAQVDADAGDGEVLVADDDGNMPRNALAV